MGMQIDDGIFGIRNPDGTFKAMILARFDGDAGVLVEYFLTSDTSYLPPGRLNDAGTTRRVTNLTGHFHRENRKTLDPTPGEYVDFLNKTNPYNQMGVLAQRRVESTIAEIAGGTNNLPAAFDAGVVDIERTLMLENPTVGSPVYGGAFYSLKRVVGSDTFIDEFLFVAPGWDKQSAMPLDLWRFSPVNATSISTSGATPSTLAADARTALGLGPAVALDVWTLTSDKVKVSTIDDTTKDW